MSIRLSDYMKCQADYRQIERWPDNCSSVGNDVQLSSEGHAQNLYVPPIASHINRAIVDIARESQHTYIHVLNHSHLCHLLYKSSLYSIIAGNFHGMHRFPMPLFVTHKLLMHRHLHMKLEEKLQTLSYDYLCTPTALVNN